MIALAHYCPQYASIYVHEPFHVNNNCEFSRRFKREPTNQQDAETGHKHNFFSIYNLYVYNSHMISFNLRNPNVFNAERQRERKKLLYSLEYC